jgi:nicotinic acid mononucleotide adenylyltransferase
MSYINLHNGDPDYIEFKNTYEATTDYRVSKKRNEDNSVCLIYPGVFNPITPFHLEVARRSVEYINNEGFNVIKIIFVPVNASYIKEYMTFGYIRADLIHNLINIGDYPELEEIYDVSNYEIYQSKTVDTSVTLKYYEDLYKVKNTAIYYICGYNTLKLVLTGEYTKYNYFDNINFLVHPRGNSTIDIDVLIKTPVVSVIDDTSLLFERKQFTIIESSMIDGKSTTDGSSTLIRRYCANNNIGELKKLYSDDNLCNKLIKYYTNPKYLSFPLFRSLINNNNNMDNKIFKFEINNLQKKYNFKDINTKHLTESNYFCEILKHPKVVSDIIDDLKHDEFFFLNNRPTKEEKVLIKENQTFIEQLLEVKVDNILDDNCSMSELSDRIREKLFKNTLQYLNIIMNKCKKYINDNGHALSYMIRNVQQNIYQIFQKTIIKIGNEKLKKTAPSGYDKKIHPYGGNKSSYSFSYQYSLNTILRALEVIDIFHRKFSNKRFSFRKYNFYNRYVYYLDKLIRDYPKVIIIPCIFSIGSTDLMKYRFTPFHICGVISGDTFVDESIQTPLEFFIHDVNHARRINQNNIYYMKNNKLDDLSFYNKIDKEKKKIMNLFPINFPKINKADSNDVKDIKRFEKEIRKLIKMIIFEVIHEDAFVPTWDNIIEDLYFPSGSLLYPYESITNELCKFDNVNKTRNTLNRYICKWYAPAATTLSTFNKKLKNEFFDEYYRQIDQIMNVNYRTQLHTLIACLVIFYNYDINNFHKYYFDIIERLCSNIQDEKHTDNPFGFKYTGYKKRSCLLTDLQKRNIKQAFSLTDSIDWSIILKEL